MRATFSSAPRLVGSWLTPSRARGWLNVMQGRETASSATVLVTTPRIYE